MTDLLTRVARALFWQSVYHGYDDATLKAEWARTESIHRAAARAVLEALKEPTDAMGAAGLDNLFAEFRNSGTLSMSDSTVRIEFEGRDQAERFFDLMERVLSSQLDCSPNENHTLL